MSNQTPASFLTLDQLPAGAHATVKHVGSDLLDLERLKVMGLCEGQSVRVLRAGPRMIVCCCGSRIGMSQHLARQITLEPDPETCASCPAEAQK